MARRPVEADLEPLMIAVANGSSLRAACRELGVDGPDTHHWIKADEKRQQAYDEAREQRADHLAETAMGWARDAIDGKVKPDAARVAIDAIKWINAKMAPKKYGEKFQQEISGAGGAPLVVNVLRFGTGESGDIVRVGEDRIALPADPSESG